MPKSLHILLWAGLLTLGVLLVSCRKDGEATDAINAHFAEPAMEDRPFVRWWWNGNRIEDGELVRELHLLKEAGIGGVEINPIETPYGADTTGTRALQLLSDEWIDRLETTFREAERLGMRCDLLLGSGWPFGAETLPMEALLYQGGYLTIKEVICGDPKKDETDKYVLAPPNLEIRESLKRGYLSQVMGLREGTFNTLVDVAKRQIASGDWKGYVCESLFRLYASIPPDWRIKDEAEAKRYFQLFVSMTGANPQPEVPSMLGYADAVIETPTNVYVFEFKYRKSAKAAIRQIRDRGYADKWIGGKRPVTLIGINFNPKKRNIDIPVVEEA